MLKLEEKYILHLLRNSLNIKDDWDDSQRVDEQSVMDMISRNDVLLTVYSELPADVRDRNKMQFMEIISHSVNQEYEGNKILRALTEKGFDCIALKGWELRKLYPQRYMRHMADIDILVRPYKFDEIEAAMTSMGYQSMGKTGWMHDNFIKGSITVEIHKRLTDDSSAIMEWEQELWSRIIPTEQEHIFRMSSEDFYLFHFVHLYKDFMNGSLGLRRIADTWLLQQSGCIDLSFVNKWLERFGMLDFHQRMLELSEAVFGKRELTNDDEILLKHSLAHGIYGSEKSYKAGRIVGMSRGSLLSGKIHSFLAALFLPFHRMKAQYPVLQKWPVLLPIYWIKRIWELLHIEKMEKLMKQLNYSGINSKDFEEAKAFFKAGGVL